MFHISVWGVEASFGGLSPQKPLCGDGTEFWTPVTACPHMVVWRAADTALVGPPLEEILPAAMPGYCCQRTHFFVTAAVTWGLFFML